MKFREINISKIGRNKYIKNYSTTIVNNTNGGSVDSSIGLSDINNRIETNESNIKVLQTDTGTLKTDVSTINSTLTDLPNKYISKVNNDSANGCITFNAGLISDTVTSTNYSTGRGYKIYNSGDDGFMIKVGGLDNSETEFTTVSENDLIEQNGTHTVTITKNYTYTSDRDAIARIKCYSSVVRSQYLTISSEKVTVVPTAVIVQAVSSSDSGYSSTSIDDMYPATNKGDGYWEFPINSGECVYTIKYEVTYTYNSTSSSFLTDTFTAKIAGTNEAENKTAIYGIVKYTQITSDNIKIMKDMNGIRIDSTGIYKTLDKGTNWTKLI